MKKIDNRWYDKNNNSWNSTKNTEKQAEQKSKTLIDSFMRTDCNCCGCYKCSKDSNSACSDYCNCCGCSSCDIKKKISNRWFGK